VFGTATLTVDALDNCGKDLVVCQLAICKIEDQTGNLMPHGRFPHGKGLFYFRTSGLDYSLQRLQSLGIAFHRGVSLVIRRESFALNRGGLL